MQVSSNEVYQGKLRVRERQIWDHKKWQKETPTLVPKPLFIMNSIINHNV